MCECPIQRGSKRRGALRRGRAVDVLSLSVRPVWGHDESAGQGIGGRCAVITADDVQAGVGPLASDHIRVCVTSRFAVQTYLGLLHRTDPPSRTT